MSAEPQHYINALLVDFRELVIGLQSEQQELMDNLQKLDLDHNNNNNNGNNHFHNHIRHNNIHSAITSTTTTTTTESPITDETQQFGPNSSSTGGSGSTQRTTSGLSSLIYRQYHQHQHQHHEQQQGHQHHHHHQQQRQRLEREREQYQESRREDRAPKPPTRTKRKSATLSRSQIMSTTIAGRGALIILEGLDRVGKSTLAKMLVKHLEKTKKSALYYRFPDRTTPIGVLIDQCLRCKSINMDEHAMQLLFTANRWELAKTIRSNIEQGTTCIVDRYSYSGMAYSPPSLDLNWCRELERGLPRPDLVIYLELPKRVQHNREGFGEERYETEDMQELARAQYEKVMDLSKETWLRIDVDNKSPDQLLGEIILPVKRCLESCVSKDLGDLDFFN